MSDQLLQVADLLEKELVDTGVIEAPVVDEELKPDENLEEEGNEPLEKDAALPDEVGEELEADKPAEGEEHEDEGGIDTLNDLADTLETPVEDMYQIGVKLSDGENQTIGSLKDFYESNKDVDQMRTSLEEDKESYAQQLELVNQMPKISDEYLQAKAQSMAIVSQYESIDWNALREKNPGQYAAMQTDFRTKYEYAQQAESLAKDKVDVADKQTEKFQQDKLFTALPDLKDNAVRIKAAQDVAEITKGYGFTPQEIEAISDSRLMHLLIDYARLKAVGSSAADKQVIEKTVIKNGKPSASKPVLVGSAKRKATLSKLTKKALESGDRTDQANAVTALIS